MSTIFDSLRDEAGHDDNGIPFSAIMDALLDPTDEQVDAVAAAEYALRIPSSRRGYWRQPDYYKEIRRIEARRWLAAVAGPRPPVT